MQSLSQYDEDAIRELFMGRKVVAVEMFEHRRQVDGRYNLAAGKLTLDDGREVFVAPNEGGCICSAGDYDLTSLERVENIITRVDVETPPEDKWGERQGAYRIFVLAGHERINLMTVEGDDGNGYYGTGYELFVVG